MYDPKNNITIERAMQIEPGELKKLLEAQCAFYIPPSIDTADDLEKAMKYLSQYGSWYAYFSGMRMSARLLKREYKRQGDKEKAEAALIREEIFENFSDRAAFVYNTISRMVSIKKEYNQELRMTGDQVLYQNPRSPSRQ